MCLIIFSAIKNSLFDVYFKRITALLTGSLYPFIGAYLTSFTLFAVGFSVVMRAYLSPFTLLTLVLVFFVFAKIFQIFRCSVFVHILNSVFHFYIKQKKINSFCKIFQKTRIKNISKDSFEILFRVAVKYELPKAYFSTGISLK